MHGTRLGEMGFSAGASLCVRILMAADSAQTGLDFLALPYASIPEGAGDTVTADWPPMFAVHAHDDTTTPAEMILDLYSGYRRHQVPAELHVYPEGGHAFGLGVRGGAVAEWPDLFARWVKATGEGDDRGL